MRLISAAIFSIILIYSIVVVASNGIFNSHSAVAKWGFIGLIIVIVLAIHWLFNGNGLRLTPMSIDEKRERLNKQGKLLKNTYKGFGYFEINEWGDEGLHYFIDIGDSKTMYLSGQYLYDYEEILDIEEDLAPQRKSFPSEDFSVIVNKDGDYVFEILPTGNILKKMFDDLKFSNSKQRKSLNQFKDRQIIGENISEVYKKLKC